MLTPKLLDRFSRASLRSIALFIGLLVLLDVLSALLAERFWFAEVGYLQVFQVRLVVQVSLGLLGFGLSAILLGGNLALAHRCTDTVLPADARLAGRLKLRRLLLLTLALNLTIGGLVVYYGRAIAQHWHSHPSTRSIVLSWQHPLWSWSLEILIVLLLLVFPQGTLWAIALLLSLGCGLVLADHWQTALLSFHHSAFSRTDPLFGRDLGDYIFQLPLWELLNFWLVGLLVVALVSVLLVYVRSGDSLSQGEFAGFSSPQRRHLCAIGGGLMLAIALNNWLDRYHLLYDPSGASYGASYVNVKIQLPVETGLSILALAIALFLIRRALAWPHTASAQVWSARLPLPPAAPEVPTVAQEASGATGRPILRSLYKLPPPKPTLRFSPYSTLLSALLLYGLIALLFNGLLPLMVQRLIVQPNELLREQPFIERTIAATRHAFELDEIDAQSFNVQDALNLEAIDRNDLTIRNIRLWDTKPLLQTNRQLQRFRPYYEFPGADIDRYTLSTPEGGSEQQQVLISARELYHSAVPPEAKTWVNEHLVYTHGFGFTMSPVNVAAEGGLPDYLIEGIEHRPSSDRVRNSIPVGTPRIYYGEIANTHIYAPTRVPELDYPSGSENAYNTYDGQGGISIDPFWKRLLFASYLRDWRLLFNQDFTPDTRVLFRRNIVDRVQSIAPFLQLDGDPYLAVAAVPGEANTLYWILDAYTTSNRYPYSAPGSNEFNYIRNSVKVIVDAYHGTVRFFIADLQDPIAQSWSRIFPGMIQPLDQMPTALRAHLRYPQDYYRIQSDQLMLYHMTEPQVFYNREDLWRAPNEIYGSEPQLVQPYYLIMKLPDRDSEEFLLFRPFTPDQRTNLIAWLAARSDISRSADEDDRPGQLLLYRFSKQELVFGPEQLEARFNQD
ncbi:MAG: COG1615 family transporter, partial [Microcoleus sp. SIO2G3]|nr:COG1615 family transporter [Microcoleus sp. SIO2G3]